jgi:hypothetical protein
MLWNGHQGEPLPEDGGKKRPTSVGIGKKRLASIGKSIRGKLTNDYVTNGDVALVASGRNE